MTKDVIKRYTNGEVTVIWQPTLCELSGEVYDDLVAIGRAPDPCPLHSATVALPPQ